MCKKLIYLIPFVFVLGSVSNAEDIQWTDLGADHLWSTPENWNLGRVPTLDDEVLIDVPAAAAPNGPVIQDGIDAKAKGIFNEAPGEPTLTMTGGTLEVAEWIWWGDGADSFGIWDMSGGTVDVTNEFELGWGGGAGTLTMTGGTINAGEAVIPTGSGAFGELFLNGGTYNVTKPGGLSVKENGLIDITEGTLVLEGDETAKINDLIAAGLITVYGGAGQFELDFDGRNPGKTTVTAQQVDMEIGFAAQPPVLDGQVDEIWADASTQYFVPLDDPANASGSWMALYDSENLYVIVDMTDDSLMNDSASSWQDDSVELYFDGGNTKVNTPLSGDDHQYTFGWTTDDIQGTNITGATEGIEHAQVDTDTGWRIEIKMPWLSIQGAEPQAGDLIGIDCYYNDDDDGGDSRENKLLSFSTVEGWNDASQWGTAMLTADKRVDVTAPGDAIQGVPNDGLMDGDNFGWPGAETPDLAIDDNTGTKFLHFKGELEPTGFQVTPTAEPTIVTGLTLTTANDAVERDPISFELSGSNEGIDGPYELIASGEVVDFAQADAWPRFTMNATKILFDNDVAYAHYQVLFPAVRDAGSANSMQIAEVELLGVPDPAGPVGHWKLDEGEGAVAVDSSGNGNDGTIGNLNGGLGLDGSVWVDDPERGTVISFNGTAEGAFVRAGNIPQMTLTNDFTWAFWAKHNAENTADNDIILGNRMDENAVDFVPRQFIKFTPTKFEWHMNGNGDDNLDYDDIPADVWLHHAVVKTADQLTYYRNGIEASSGTFTQPLDFPQPLFFGGDNEGAEGENWSGLMSDVRIYNRALSENEVIGLAGKTPVDPGSDGLVAFYALENDVLDSSGNGNDGTIVGDPNFIEGPDGYGMAMEFHGLGAAGGGGDYIDCGNDASLDIPGPISIALWIKPGADDPEGQGTETAPMAKAMSGISPWNWQVRYGWGSPQPYMAFTFNSSPRAWAYVGQNLVRNEWAHIACSHDGTTLKCFLNGEQTDSTPMGEIATGEAPVLIGSDGWGCDWIGGIDEVAIYNRDLSAGEVRYLAGFRAMVEPGTKGLAAAYEFETDATDSSGNGNDGTLLGDAHVQGGLLVLDGDDDAVAIPGIGDGLTEFTFSMMVYPTVDVVPLQFSGGINTDSWGGGVHLKLNYGTVNVGVEPFAGGDVVGTTIVQPNTWTHLALTVSPDEVAVYLNGEKEGSRIVETGLAVNVGAATIGAWNNGGTDVQREMTGMMDNVLIYDRALSEAEVRYLASVKTDPMNLIPNPSFEEDEPILDDPDWVSWCTWNPAEGAGSNTTIVDTESIDGTRSLQVEPIGAENWFFILVNISFAANLDKNYTAGFWAKAVAPRPLTVQMKASDNSVDAWGATDFELTTEWAEYSYTSEVLHTDVKLEFLCAGSEVPFWLDLVSVYEAE